VSTCDSCCTTLLARNAVTRYAVELDTIAPLAVRIGLTVREILQPLKMRCEQPNEVVLKTFGAVR
jgi:hypothetical protein